MNHLAEASIHMMDESRWQRVTDLFDQLLEGGDTSSEADPEIREAALNLWRHHVRADRENYLGAPMEFEILPIFRAGQVLLNRFHIEKKLGSGGMGEVYLAWDERIQERVAIKTIARLLAPSPSIRRRFAAEVQSARRVTHCNVCRIHEIFDYGETVFFSMEFVDGRLLSDIPRDTLTRQQALAIVLQMAKALHAAHLTSVVHGDFKPSNVMIENSRPGKPPRAVIMDFGLARAFDRAATADEPLSVRAGTGDYMAPELHGNAAPTVHSDIFAFGKVAEELVPGNRLWKECTTPSPEQRPATLEEVIRKLEPPASRRYWLSGLAIATAGLALETVRLTGARFPGLPAGARILVNGFQAAAAEVPGARLFRSVLLTALQQSSRIHPIADQDLLPALRRLQPRGTLPIAGKLLTDILSQLRAGFFIDGALRQSGGRYSLDLRLSDTSGHQSLAGQSFHDAPSVVALAQTAATWIRKTAGESLRSLDANPTNVASYTSDVPEALQKYYDAMEQYALGAMTTARAFLEEALRLDGRFAQAHHVLGLVANSQRLFDEGTREIEIAHQLADSRKLPEAERIPIDTSYYSATEDPWKMVETARRSVVFNANEPRSYTVLGQSLATAGSFDEAIQRLRQAVNLAPEDWIPVLALGDALVEAGQFSQALDEFQSARARGVQNNWFFNGIGSACMCLERYDEASRNFANEPLDGSNGANLQGANIMQGRLDLAVAAMQEQQARVMSPVDKHQAAHYLCALYYITGRADLARRHVAAMAEIPAVPKSARRLAGVASWARRLGANDTLGATRQSLSEIARRWPNALTQAVEMHANALDAWRSGSLDTAEDLLLKSLAANSIWTLYDLAELFTYRAKWNLAEEYWSKFEARRGTVVIKGLCPVILVLGWHQHAIAAQARNDRAKAFQYATKVLDHWGPNSPHLQVVQQSAHIAAVNKSL